MVQIDISTPFLEVISKIQETQSSTVIGRKKCLKELERTFLFASKEVMKTRAM